MRKLLCGTASLLLIICATNVNAQKAAIKFGDIKAEEFSPKYYNLDSSANAVVLSDIGSSKYEGDTHGGFSVVFKRHTRIRILSRNAFDVATFAIQMYSSGSFEERIENLEASTYNLENGTVQVTKLDKASIFKDKLSKNWSVRKFTMPNLKEGCIIEIKYTFSSPYERYVRGWQFQREYPVLYSEYKTSIPAVYEFVTFRQGYHPYLVDKGESISTTYNIIVPGSSASDRSELVNFKTTAVENIWAMENVPALKKENFTTTLDNYVSKIDFQLARERWPNAPVKNVMNGWLVAAEKLLQDPDFGESLTKSNNWMSDDLKKITQGAEKGLETARRIFEYVRDNFTCTNHNRFYLSSPIKKTFETKSGSVADLNLLLTAMLNQQGFFASPVLLSTRENGKVYEAYPIMEQLNYVVCDLKLDDKSYLLDASRNKLGFGMLASDCYNGPARIIAEMPTSIDLSPDSLRENKLTSVIIINDEKEGLVGSYTSTLGYNESYALREKIGSISEQDLFTEIKKGFGLDIELSNGQIDSLKKLDERVAIKYDFKFKADEDMLYVNPVFSEAVKENPFKAHERLYPVEMPYAVNETYILRMDIPKGYKIEELPKSTRVKLNENEGVFEYLVSNDQGVIQLRSSLRLNKATFEPEDYDTLRNFYGYMVKKHGEQIVLKKIN